MHYFEFYEAFSKEMEYKVYKGHLETFLQRVHKTIMSSQNDDHFSQMVVQEISLSILLGCSSKFYQRQLLRAYSESDLLLRMGIQG